MLARRYVGVVLSWIGGGIALLGAAGPLMSLPSAAGLVQVVVLLCLALVAVGFGGWLFRAGRRIAQEPARSRVAVDHRPPVVLLRSFAADGRVAEKAYSRQQSLVGWLLGRASFEQELSNIMENLGPTVALGRPGEVLPTFGFAREYVANDAWRQVLNDYLDRCSWAVFLLYEITSNLAYEVELVLKSGPKTRVLLVPPPRKFRTTQWYEKYGALAKSVLQLPEIAPETAAVVFDPIEGMIKIAMPPEGSSNQQIVAIQQALIPRFLFS
jgi:hypothetical protein